MSVCPECRGIIVNSNGLVCSNCGLVINAENFVCCENPNYENHNSISIYFHNTFDASLQNLTAGRCIEKKNKWMHLGRINNNWVNINERKYVFAAVLVKSSFFKLNPVLCQEILDKYRTLLKTVHQHRYHDRSQLIVAIIYSAMLRHKISFRVNEFITFIQSKGYRCNKRLINRYLQEYKLFAYVPLQERVFSKLNSMCAILNLNPIPLMELYKKIPNKFLVFGDNSISAGLLYYGIIHIYKLRITQKEIVQITNVCESTMRNHYYYLKKVFK